MQAKPPTPSALSTTNHPIASMRVLLVRDLFDAEQVNLGLIRVRLTEAGFVDVSLADVSLTLLEYIAETQLGMVTVISKSVTCDAIEHAYVATQHAPCSIVLFTDNGDAAHIKMMFTAGITAYIVDGTKPMHVKAVLDIAYTRFEHERELRAKLNTAKTQPAERKVLEHTKGILMKQMSLSEDDALKRLRKMAMDRNIELAEVIQRVIDVIAG